MIGYVIWDIDPRIFPGFEYLRWYGLFWAIGMLLGYQVMLKIFKYEKLSQTDLDQLTAYVVLGAIIGARFGHVLFYEPIYYLNNPIEILPIRIEPKFEFTGFAGLASHGGVLGALVALFLYCRKFQKDIFWNLDRLTIAASLMGGFIRLGNLMNSEIIGMSAQAPWAFVFLKVDQVPRHPAQLYEALCYFAIFIILFILWKSGRHRNHKGFLFGLGLLLVFIQRFLMEFLKENQVAFEENLTLNMGQVLSIPLIVIGMMVIVWSQKRFTDKKQSIKTLH
ncbi:prolipoprotein diacylglyceryl transferase [Belliella marina]|uniref:Phosphatidylglycerol--prolipoprotein diacylglyceryl transferase n=1 Tax=Belliella marina TaxID=1644146 RepID=A0ABW4VP40_9BACT